MSLAFGKACLKYVTIKGETVVLESKDKSKITQAWFIQRKADEIQDF